jgi:hypothetical protein
MTSDVVVSSAGLDIGISLRFGFGCQQHSWRVASHFIHPFFFGVCMSESSLK